MSNKSTIETMAKSARKASRTMAKASSRKKNEVLLNIAERLEKKAFYIKDENRKDIEAAREKGLSDAMIDRLATTDSVIESMAKGLREVAALEDPVGAISKTVKLPNDLQASRMRIPLGVIGIIYESRPNVTIDAAGLCIKAGNAVILRGGSEAFHSNRALAGVMAEALSKSGFPPEVAQVVSVRDRSAIKSLLKQEEYIDLIIPRGGEGLIRFVTKNSRIPVLKHYKGVCHIYVDEGADIEMAQNICLNAKVQRPGVCNAMETMLAHESIAPDFLPEMGKQFKESGVIIRGCEKTRAILPDAEKANENDWPREYLDLILAVKVVSDMEGAFSHISEYSSSHTEAIVTSDYARARRFVKEVDSSVVLVNASTRFNDGGQLGLGAEIGISTSKLHAFGPMGVEELTATKFVVFGDGQVRD